MNIPEKLKLEYLLELDAHIDTVGKKNKEATMKKIFEITKDEKLYLKYEQWRKDNKF